MRRPRAGVIDIIQFMALWPKEHDMTDSEKKEWEKIKAARKLYLAKAIQAESRVNLFTAAKESDLVVFWKNVRAHYKALYLQALRGEIA